MYDERKAELDAGIQSEQENLTNFLTIANHLYNDLGLIGEVHSKTENGLIKYILYLIDRQENGDQLVKEINPDGSATGWYLRPVPPLNNQ